MTLPDLFVIRIGTAKGTASHEMMHERVGSTRPNMAGGGGRERRKDTRCAIRSAARSEVHRGAVASRRNGRSWERRKKRKLVTDSYRVGAATADGNNGEKEGGIYFNSVIPLFSDAAPIGSTDLHPFKPAISVLKVNDYTSCMLCYIPFQ